ncbi:CGNR zinc finger domain-containing protein [Nocardia sp. NPDC088792]|uniref:CGNR zinc finger domain-containing protein n=1 Tax=Nocardia sp. NPDC088792 TaxID=3364332 RepID=UPI00382C4D21
MTTVSTFEDAHLWVSGNLALNFIGTVEGRRDYAENRLKTPADLGGWIVAAGLLDSTPDCTTGDLDRATELREVGYRMALALLGGESFTEADLALVNGIARGALPEVVLTAPGHVHRTGTIDSALAAIARSAVELFGGPDRTRIKECEREACTRLYIDTSRGGSRRWCDMGICGNRAKSAAFRARNT